MASPLQAAASLWSKPSESCFGSTGIMYLDSRCCKCLGVFRWNCFRGFLLPASHVESRLPVTKQHSCGEIWVESKIFNFFSYNDFITVDVEYQILAIERRQYPKQSLKEKPLIRASLKDPRAGRSSGVPRVHNLRLHLFFIFCVDRNQSRSFWLTILQTRYLKLSSYFRARLEKKRYSTKVRVVTRPAKLLPLLPWQYRIGRYFPGITCLSLLPTSTNPGALEWHGNFLAKHSQLSHILRLNVYDVMIFECVGQVRQFVQRTGIEKCSEMQIATELITL